MNGNPSHLLAKNLPPRRVMKQIMTLPLIAASVTIVVLLTVSLAMAGPLLVVPSIAMAPDDSLSATYPTLAELAITASGQSISVSRDNPSISTATRTITPTATRTSTRTATAAPPTRTRTATPTPAVSPTSILPNYPPALPRTLFLGLGNDPATLSWMTGSGIPWQARYTYLSGGVNTSSNWTTWNTPNGAYALMYMNASASANYLPVLTFDNINISLPRIGSSESQQDLSNLDNPSTMLAYYSQWKLLLTQGAAFGKPVIVHLEPDFMGYIEQSAGDNASAVPAAVASSGFPDAAGFPNNAAGFAQLLVHERDLYAPNVLLAFNVSPWAGGYDVSTASTNFDVLGQARHVANFFLSLGANFDLLFYQVSSRDAAYQQYVNGNSSYWWDATNTTLPDFTRFAQWTGALTLDTGRRGVLWHVPIGNQIYDTENNTTGHYQDNRVQYFLGPSRTLNLAQFANAGIVGIMFGAGSSSSTSYADVNLDGITNPPPIDGNTQIATVADDDGGYLRQQARSYYQTGGYVLP